MLILYSFLSASLVYEGKIDPDTKANVLLDFGFENKGKFNLVVRATNITGTKVIILNMQQYKNKYYQINSFQKYCFKNISKKYLSYTFKNIQDYSLLAYLQGPEIYYPTIINCNNISLKYVAICENPNSNVDFRQRNHICIALSTCVIEFLITISWLYRTQTQSNSDIKLLESFMFSSLLKGFASLISILHWKKFRFISGCGSSTEHFVEILHLFANTSVLTTIMNAINGMSLIRINNTVFQKIINNTVFVSYSAIKHVRSTASGYMYYVTFIVEIIPLLLCRSRIRKNGQIFNLLSDIHNNNQKMKSKCHHLEIIHEKVTSILYNVFILDLFAVIFHLSYTYLIIELEIVICTISFSCLFIFWNRFDYFDSPEDDYDNQDPFDMITVRLTQIVDQMGRDMKSNRMKKCMEGFNEYEKLVDRYNKLAETMHHNKFPENYRLKEMIKKYLEKRVSKVIRDDKSATHQTLNENKNNNTLDKARCVKDDKLGNAINDFVENRLLKNPQNKQKSDEHQTSNENNKNREEHHKHEDKELEKLHSIHEQSNENQLGSSRKNRNYIQNLDEFINNRSASEIEQMDLIAGKDRSLRFSNKRKKILEEYKDRNIGRCNIC